MHLSENDAKIDILKLVLKFEKQVLLVKTTGITTDVTS